MTDDGVPLLSTKHPPDITDRMLQMGIAALRIANLRLADPTQSRGNTVMTTRNKTGVKGISWCGRTQRYRAVLDFRGKRFLDRRFTSLAEASAAREEAARRTYREFTFEANHAA